MRIVVALDGNTLLSRGEPLTAGVQRENVLQPALDRGGLLARIRRYPDYISLTGALTMEECAEMTPETREVEGILQRFM